MSNDEISNKENELTGSEALYGFIGWLSTRDDEVTFSSHHDASIAAKLIDEFCLANGLYAPRDGWEKNLEHPE